MGIYSYPQPPLSLRAALSGASVTPRGVESESSIGSDVGKVRRGIRSESYIDVQYIRAGQFLETTVGRIIRVKTPVFDANFGAGYTDVLLVDVGNGSQDLHAIGNAATVSATSVAKATARPHSESSVATSSRNVVETATTLVVAAPTSSGVEQQADSGQLVDTGSGAQVETPTDTVPVVAPPSAPSGNGLTSSQLAALNAYVEAGGTNQGTGDVGAAPAPAPLNPGISVTPPSDSGYTPTPGPSYSDTQTQLEQILAATDPNRDVGLGPLG